jgi:hypothetical protein
MVIRCRRKLRRASGVFFLDMGNWLGKIRRFLVAVCVAMAVVRTASVTAAHRYDGGDTALFELIVAVAITVAVLLVTRKRLANAVEDVLVLGLLPAWGAAMNAALPSCDVPCTDDHPLLAQASAHTVYIAFAISAFAYVLSRRGVGRKSPMFDAAILGTVIAGFLLVGAVAIQFGAGILLGILFAPLGLPLVAPVLVMLKYGVEIRERVRSEGPADTLGSVRFLRGLGVAPFLLLSDAGVQALFTRRPLAIFDALTQTCSGTFHELSQAECHSGHYLCTVAARGTPWLVRPERLGKRWGKPIIVNRQLAVANAFEDLLHERWPRFGRLARRVYDRLGLPVSRWIKWVPMADAVYLAMKPAEWLFYGFLRCFDRGDVESRIDRMYR